MSGQADRARKKSTVQLDATKLEELMKEHSATFSIYNERLEGLGHSRDFINVYQEKKERVLDELSEYESFIRSEYDLVFKTVEEVNSLKIRCEQLWTKIEILLKNAPRVEGWKKEKDKEEDSDDETVLETPSYEKTAKKKPRTSSEIGERSSVGSINNIYTKDTKKKSANGNCAAGAGNLGREPAAQSGSAIATTASIEKQEIVPESIKRVRFTYSNDTTLASYPNEDDGNDDGSVNLLLSD
jgi:hypothetical protein